MTFDGVVAVLVAIAAWIFYHEVLRPLTRSTRGGGDDERRRPRRQRRR